MIINVIATAVCMWTTINAVGGRRYAWACIGFVIAVANMWVAIFGE